MKNLQRIVLDIPLSKVHLVDISTASTRESVDLMNLEFILCHEGVNSRGDRFTAEELKASWRTPIYKPLNWEHKEPIIGTIASSSLKKTEDGLYYIECVGKIWKFLYEDYANLIYEAMAKDSPEYHVDSAFISMEAWFSSYRMVVGDYEEVYEKGEAKAEELHELRGTYLDDGRFVSRELRNVIFGGGAITASPADKGAIIKSVASLYSNLEEYHKYLHKAFAGEIHSPLSEEQLIKEHERVHRQLWNI